MGGEEVQSRDYGGGVVPEETGVKHFYGVEPGDTLQ